MIKNSITAPNATIDIYTSPVLGYETDDLFSELLNTVAWEQRSIFMYGLDRPEPRLVAWYSDHSYTYSGLRWEPKPFLPILDSLRRTLETLTDATYNGVLLNYYKDGRSSIGMHSDDEPEFGHNPTIASLSLGAERIFTLQRKDKSVPPIKIPLTDGSVLVMAGETQEYWKHGIAKTAKPVGPRINLTFRNIVSPR